MRFILILLLSITALTAGDDWNYDNDHEYVKVPFNLGLWPGISIGDMLHDETGKKVYNNGFSLSLIGMRAQRLKGADISGIFSIYTEGVQGFQGSGIFNIVNGNVRGFQGAGIFNLSNGNISGFQGSGIFNMQNGDFRGFQGTGIFTMQNGNFQGVQINGIFSMRNGNFKGFQSNGVFGIQNGDFRGLQISEIFNIANGNFDGAQFGGIVNILNGSFNGLQVGMINIMRHFDSGLQIGLVNIAEDHNGVPIGFFTWVANVPLGYQIYYDDMQFANFTVRSGNENWYNQFTLGRRLDGDVRYHTIGGGFGRKIFLGGNFGLDAGVSGAVLLDDNFKHNKDLGAITRLNLLFHFALPYEGSIFAGPVIHAWYSKLANEDLSGKLWVEETKDDYILRVWPGFVVGIML
ncbi:MAG: hypothetical protein KDF60_17320 [Calditrichaeota bacterium]|nr:hypothetical protein [Calditrichota bacterium]